MSQSIDIVISTNHTYHNYGLALVSSILANTRDPRRIVFHLFSRNITDKQKKQFNLLVHRYLAKLQFYNLPDAIYRDLPAKDYKSLDAYSRLFAPAQIDTSADKLIYLDIDTIVRADIKNLYETDLKDNTIAAVRDVEYEKGEGKSPLFNSGVMIIDRKRWLERKIEEQVLVEVRRSKGGLVPLADQDDLNVVLSGDWQPLNPKWNVMSGNVYYHELLPAQAFILHFNGGTIHKPDHPFCVNPGKTDYFKYLSVALGRRIPIFYLPVFISRVLLFLSRLWVLQLLEIYVKPNNHH